MQLQLDENSLLNQIHVTDCVCQKPREILENGEVGII